MEKQDEGGKERRGERRNQERDVLFIGHEVGGEKGPVFVPRISLNDG